MDTTETLVIGAGQAGLALSSYLSAAAHDHVLLERGRIGERWRSERWPSLSLLTPNRFNRLPGSPAHADPDGYLARDEFVDYLGAYARSFAAPVAEGVSVLSVRRAHGGFHVRTDSGDWSARNVVLATGDSDVPRVPAAASAVPAGILQLHAGRYRSPDELPPGAVLVVGAGPSGQQLAADLRRAGRDVVLSVGRHARMVRRYRGFDIFHWLAETGDLERTIDEVADPEAARRTPNLPLDGRCGGRQLDLGVLADGGVLLAGRLTGFSGRHALFAGDLAASAADADRRMRRVLAKLDRHVERLPASAAGTQPDPVPAVEPGPGPASLDLRAHGVGTIVWATGYRRAYPWLHVPVLDAAGEAIHRRGVTAVPGLYMLGLRFQYRRNSHFIGGVGRDAHYLASRILLTVRRRPPRAATLPGALAQTA